MSDVAVIGTGAMGSALAETLAAAGAEVRVWNRNEEKTEELSGPRIHPTGSVGEALTSSPLAIVSVSDHEIGRTLVETAGVELDGTVVASTSFVTPDQARTYAATVSVLGGCYLDLSIAAYPSDVRSGAGVLFISGDGAAYQTHRERFEGIGRVSYIDDTPAAAFIGEMAVLLAYLPMAVGLLQGRRICDRHGLAVEWFEEMVLELYPPTSDRCCRGSRRRGTRRRRRWRLRSTPGPTERRSTPTTSVNWAWMQGCTTRCSGCSPLRPKPVTATPTGRASPITWRRPGSRVGAARRSTAESTANVHILVGACGRSEGTPGRCNGSRPGFVLSRRR
jgi:hypothetical protein